MENTATPVIEEMIPYIVSALSGFVGKIKNCPSVDYKEFYTTGVIFKRTDYRIRKAWILTRQIGWLSIDFRESAVAVTEDSKFVSPYKGSDSYTLSSGVKLGGGITGPYITIGEAARIIAEEMLKSVDSWRSANMYIKKPEQQNPLPKLVAERDYAKAVEIYLQYSIDVLRGNRSLSRRD